MKRLVRAGAACVMAMIGLGISGCAPSPDPEGAATGLEVVATTTIVADLVRQVGGDDVVVTSLMGAGVDPHLYKPTAGDVRRLTSADAVFFNGLHLEGKMGDVLEEVGTRGVRTVAVAECIDEGKLLGGQGFTGVHDPHVWFDVALWSNAAECTADALADLDPDHREGYAARAEAYLGELAELDDWVKAKSLEIPEAQRVLVTAHDAFSYFGRAYGFEVRGLLGISTAAEAGASDVKNLADFIHQRRIPAVFVETSVSPRFVRAVQEAVADRGFEVAIGGQLYSDALGNPDGPAATYIGTVTSNVETIVGALAVGGAE